MLSGGTSLSAVGEHLRCSCITHRQNFMWGRKADVEGRAACFSLFFLSKAEDLLSTFWEFLAGFPDYSHLSTCCKTSRIF